MSSFAGTLRTLVAVGMVSELAILVTTRALAPRMGEIVGSLVAPEATGCTASRGVALAEVGAGRSGVRCSARTGAAAAGVQVQPGQPRQGGWRRLAGSHCRAPPARWRFRCHVRRRVGRSRRNPTRPGRPNSGPPGSSRTTRPRSTHSGQRPRSDSRESGSQPRPNASFIVIGDVHRNPPSLPRNAPPRPAHIGPSGAHFGRRSAADRGGRASWRPRPARRRRAGR